MILDLLKKRYSVRDFLDKPVPDEIVREMLEAARLSPSGGNEQAWAFGVVADKELIARIAAFSYYNKDWIEKAPLIVALCTRITEPFSVCKKRFPGLEDTNIGDAGVELCTFAYMEEHQIKIPGTQMAMAALEHGVGCTWISHYSVTEVAKVLKLPQHYLPSNLLAFGYPLADNPNKSRNTPGKREINDIVFYNSGENLPPADTVPHWS